MEEEYMEPEHRRGRRIPVAMHLEVSHIFKQNNIKVSNINAPIEVIDISKYGIGFISASVLPIGYYFNSRLQFKDEKNSLNCVVRIIRRKQREDGLTVYGCEFVGMSPVFDYIFEDAEKEYSNRADEDVIE